ncbi:MAG: DUF2934 domain-containing protein [Planctomycetota bacterium]
MNQNIATSSATLTDGAVAKTLRATATPTPTREQIAERAYHIYLENGCPDGQSVEHWLQAEKELTDQLSKARATK